MKNLLITCAILFASPANTQSFFQQKKPKLKYIEQQIALFEIYAGYLKLGYKIAHDGWSMVNGIKHGDFDLHNNYFNSLKQVNPAISDY